MAKYIKIIQDCESPTGKLWIVGKIIMVADELATKMIEDKKAQYSTAPDNELVEAVKQVKKKHK